MSNEKTLGRLEDLPADYVQGLRDRNLMPLWPALRNALPHERPVAATRPTIWHYADVRPQLMAAGSLAPIEKAERRVLVLCNPGLGIETLRATASIYIGMQLILPGELAPNHRHTPSAIRFAVEGRGGYTVVNGEKLPMEKGDLILTPALNWHEHGHEGSDPVIWLDALDLPIITNIEASYSVEGQRHVIEDPYNTSNLRFARGGVVPYEMLNRQRAPYPLLRFPWCDVKATLDALSHRLPPGGFAHVAYVNPETGQECLPTLGFSALKLPVGQPVELLRQSASMVLHVVSGEGLAVIDGHSLPFSEADTLAAPTHARITLSSSGTEPVYIFVVDDAPLQRKLGIHQVFNERS